MTDKYSSDDGIRPYRVTYYDTETGREASEVQDYEWSLYLWTDGNFGCACNRGMFLDRVLGCEQDDPGGQVWSEELGRYDPPVPYPCGGRRYRIRATTMDGRVLYDDRGE